MCPGPWNLPDQQHINGGGFGGPSLLPLGRKVIRGGVTTVLANREALPYLTVLTSAGLHKHLRYLVHVQNQNTTQSFSLVRVLG